MRNVVTVVFGEEIDLHSYRVTICGSIDGKYYDDAYFGILTFKRFNVFQGAWILTTVSGEEINTGKSDIDDALWELSIKVFSYGSKKVNEFLKQK